MTNEATPVWNDGVMGVRRSGTTVGKFRYVIPESSAARLPESSVVVESFWIPDAATPVWNDERGYAGLE